MNQKCNQQHEIKQVKANTQRWSTFSEALRAKWDFSHLMRHCLFKQMYKFCQWCLIWIPFYGMSITVLLLFLSWLHSRLRSAVDCLQRHFGEHCPVLQSALTPDLDLDDAELGMLGGLTRHDVMLLGYCRGNYDDQARRPAGWTTFLNHKYVIFGGI